jgi:outer membrane immunogenic protein
MIATGRGRNMKWVALTSVAALAFGLLPAAAADMPTPAPKPVYKAPEVVRAYNWSGFYIGANGGYSFGNSKTTLTAAPFNFDLKPTGWVGGGQAGANWQNGNIVWGIETDFQATGEKDTSVCDTPTCTPEAFAKARINWFGTGRGRLGVAADNVLFYATGGVAYAHVGFQALQLGVYSVGYDKVRVGWTGGGGIEVGFGNWSLKAEYLYFDVGSQSVAFVDPTLPTVDFKTRWTDNVVRAGLNYRFNNGM